MAGAVRVSVNVDLSGIAGRFSRDVLADVTEQLSRAIEADMRPYVKRDTGELEASPELASDFRAGEIAYTADQGDGEYAGYAYDDPNVGDHGHNNPQATHQWDVVAANDHMGDWERIAARLLTKGA